MMKELSIRKDNVALMDYTRPGLHDLPLSFSSRKLRFLFDSYIQYQQQA